MEESWRKFTSLVWIVGEQPGMRDLSKIFPSPPVNHKLEVKKTNLRLGGKAG